MKYAPSIAWLKQGSRKNRLPLRVLLALMLIGLLLYSLLSRHDLPEMSQIFIRQCQRANLLWLVGALLLMPINWLAETWKWRQFMQRYETLSTWQALKAVWAGVAVSLFTPNRIGEYGGRLFFVQRRHQWQAVAANIVGNFSQLLVLLTAGGVGVVLFASMFFPEMAPWLEVFCGLGIIGLSLLHFLFFNLQQGAVWASRLPVLSHSKRFVKILGLTQHFNRQDLVKQLGWAWCRYAIYATQYWLLLQFFAIQTGVWAGFAGIATLFLLQTSLPLSPILALAVRGNLSIFVWQQFGASAVNSLAATFSLWIINLILPAFLGTFSLISTKKTDKSAT